LTLFSRKISLSAMLENSLEWESLLAGRSVGGGWSSHKR
jgi:hypothetical protein